MSDQKDLPKDLQLQDNAARKQPDSIAKRISERKIFEIFNPLIVNVEEDKELIIDPVDKSDLVKHEAALEKLIKSHPDEARTDLAHLRELSDYYNNKGNTDAAKGFDKDIAVLRKAMANVGVKETQGTGHGVTASNSGKSTTHHGPG